MKMVFIALAAFIISLVFAYSWLNRDSDRVILTLFTAIIIGAIGFVTKESISNKVEKFSSEFPVAVLFTSPDYKPPMNFNAPYFFDMQMCMQAIDLVDLPDDTNQLDIKYGQSKYFSILQFIILKTIFDRFSQGWDVTSKEIRMPSGMQLLWSASDKKGDEIEIDSLLSQIPNRDIIDACKKPLEGRLRGHKAFFPPKTEVQVSADDVSEAFSVKMKNKFIEINIVLTSLYASVGHGDYAADKGFISVNVQNGHAVYLMNVDIKQNPWLNGHPEMKCHRSWAESVLTLLENTFDYERIRQNYIDHTQQRHALTLARQAGLNLFK
jgi:hypothetical protein